MTVMLPVRPPPPLLHVGIYLHDLSGGGVERCRLRLIPELQRRRVRVTLLLHARTGELAGCVPDGVEVISIGRRPPTRTWADAAPLARWLRSAKPDLLLSSLDHNNIAALLAAALARTRVPVVICQHNALSSEAATTGWRYRLVPLAYRVLQRRAAGIVAVSHGVAADLAAACAIRLDRITVIHNPILDASFELARLARCDHPWFAPSSGQADTNQPPVFVAVGRLVEQKDPATLLAAFARRRRLGPARLAFLGAGPLAAALQSQAAALGIAADVAFLGYQANPLPFIRQAAALVLSSRYEGLGNVIIEALGCATPVISTDCPFGPAEILRHGRHGRLVPVGDVAALAAAMACDLRAEFPAAGLRARAAEFTVERCADAYLRLFRSLNPSDADHPKTYAPRTYAPRT